jgi:Ca2+-transporting ATPase
MPAERAASALGTDPARGLSDAEAAARLVRDGPNMLAAAPPTPWWRRFVAQLRSTVVLLLIAATGISLVLWLTERDTALPYNAIAILAIVLLNATLGLVQELRAESAVAALLAMTAPEATVVRDGVVRRVPARSVVVGDVIVVEEGDVVPADARVRDAIALQVAEAVLTGESVAVEKDPAPVEESAMLGDRTDMLFSGTTVAAGRGRAIVVATGMQTEIGHVAGMLDEVTVEQTPLQRELDRLGVVLGRLVVGLAIVMIAIIFAFSGDHRIGAVIDMLLLGVALAVAAVPEGLPAIVTAVLAAGVRRMARRQAIVRRLASVETLGAATVIASDKTGTLTSNEMTVRAVVTSSGRAVFSGSGLDPEGEVAPHDSGALDGALREELERTLVAAALANNASVHHREGRWHLQGDPTEGALIVAARKAGLDPASLGDRWPRIGEHPFSSERKLMSTVHRREEDPPGHVLFAKGAPDVLLRRCTHARVGGEAVPLSDERRDALLEANDAMAGEALRTLAVAYRPLAADGDQRATRTAHTPDALERELVFLGIVGMIDPPRPHARDAVQRARDAGIRPLLITGDHPRTAAVIAQELGIATDSCVVTGAELEALSDQALAERVRDVSVFARVDPAHKLRIVRALQANGEVVAMTGDGVNDAPALRAADIGIAMGRAGTDVAREAADMVLADDDFATIVAAVEEGRGIYANIRRCLHFLLSGNFGEVAAMFLAVVAAGMLGLRDGSGSLILPLLAPQILWINLLTDGAPALALGIDPAESGLMRRRPRGRGEPLISPRIWRQIVWLGLVMGIGTLAVFDASLPGGLIEGGGDVARARTMAFTSIVLFQLFNLLNARSEMASAFAHASHTRWIWGAIALSVGLQVLVLELPALRVALGTTSLGAVDWAWCIAVGSSVLWIREITKLVARRSNAGR